MKNAVLLITVPMQASHEVLCIKNFLRWQEIPYEQEIVAPEEILSRTNGKMCPLVIVDTTSNILRRKLHGFHDLYQHMQEKRFILV